jgi:hypothetical protein
LKLENINKYNEEIDANYSLDEDVITLSHKIFLSKLKSNVKKGIENKISQFNSAKSLHQVISSKTDQQIDQINKNTSDKIIQYLNSDFNLNTIISKFKLSKSTQSNDKNNRKSTQLHGGILAEKVTDGYNNLFAKYQSKEKINTSNIDDIADFDLFERDPLFEDAAKLIVNSQNGSTSLLQRKMKLGYNRAGRLIDQLEAAEIIGPSQGSEPREVLIKTEKELNQILDNLN